MFVFEWKFSTLQIVKAMENPGVMVAKRQNNNKNNKNKLKDPEAILVVCNPSMNKLWAT